MTIFFFKKLMKKNFAELWDGEEKFLLRNVTERRVPRFDLDRLQPGKRLIIKIYSANNKGGPLFRILL